MAAPYLNSYIAPYKPLSNVTPFTYKDGATYLEVLEGMRTYINDTLVEFVNENFTELGDEFETQVNVLIIAVNEAIASVVDNSAEVQDAIVEGLVNDTESLTRVAMDTVYAGQVTDAAVAAIVVAGDTKTALDSAYAGQVTDAAVDAIVTDTEGDTRTTLDGLYAGQSSSDAQVAGWVEDTESDTRTALDTLYAGQVTDAAVAAIVVAGDTKTALDSAYDGQVTDAAVAAIVVAGDTKTALDSAYAGLTFVQGFLTSDGILIPAFETSELPDPSEFDDGVIVFDTDDSLIKISVSGEWTALEGGGDPIGTITEAGTIAIGNGITPPSSVWPSLTIGNAADNDAPVSIAIGDNTVIAGGGAGANAIAVGYGAQVGDTGEAHGGGIAIGQGSKSYKTGGGGSSSVALGANADADGSYATVLGGGASADADYTVALGGSAAATADRGIALGASATADGDYSVAIGGAANVDTDDGIAIGHSASVTGTDSAQIGGGTNADDDTLQSRYPIFKMPDLVFTALSSYIPTINDTAVMYPGGLSAPPTIGLSVGVSYFDTTEGIPLWLKTIEVAPEDNVWVDATGTTVYPAA